MTLFVTSVAANLTETESNKVISAIPVSYSGVNVCYEPLCMSLVDTSSYYVVGGKTIGQASFRFTRSSVHVHQRVVDVVASIEGDGPLLRVFL